MTKRMLIDAAHPEEVRVVIEQDGRIEDYEVETAGKEQIKGNIYVGEVTRVEPSLQAAFISYGGNRNGFLAFSEIHPEYFDLPEEERQALLNELQEVADRRAEREAEREERWETQQSEKEVKRLALEAEKTAVKALDMVDLNLEGMSVEEPAQETTQPEEVTATTADTSDASAEEDATAESSEAVAEETTEAAPKKRKRRAPRKKKSDDSIALASAPVDEIIAEDDNLTGTMTDDHSDDTAEEKPTSSEVSEDDESEEKDNKRSRRRRSPTSRRPRRHTKDSAEDDAEFKEHAHTSEDTSSKDQHIEDDNEDASDEEERRVPIHRRYSIDEVLKEGQKILIQVNKEERGNKGAALSTYISLPGRFSVLMPNTPYAGGISRKVTEMETRRELKRIVKSLEVPNTMGLIVRTAGVGQAEACIKKDVKNLLKHWDNIQKGFKEATKAPALVHEDGALAIRAMRDLLRDDIDEVVISGRKTYRATKNYVKSLLPESAKRIKEHRAQTPIFSHFHVEDALNKLHTVRVDLPSGGYLIINPTEALISVDVNSGKATQEKNIEETALKTNLEAADEMARQLRLRDLAGLVVIDFIDMENSKNERALEKAMRKAVKQDRARIQLAPISQFGLMEMSRQRLRPSLGESVMVSCPHCHGTGTIPSLASAALMLLRTLESDTVRTRAERVVITTSHEMALYILNNKRQLLANIEERYGFQISLRGDDKYVAPDHNLEVIHTDSKGNEKRTSQEIILREILDEEDTKARRKRNKKKKPEQQQNKAADKADKQEKEEKTSEKHDDEHENTSRDKNKSRSRNRRRKHKDHADKGENEAGQEKQQTEHKPEDADHEKSDKPNRRKRKQSGANKSNHEKTESDEQSSDKKDDNNRRRGRKRSDKRTHNSDDKKKPEAKGIVVETISETGKKSTETVAKQDESGSTVKKAIQRWWSKN